MAWLVEQGKYTGVFHRDYINIGLPQVPEEAHDTIRPYSETRRRHLSDTQQIILLRLVEMMYEDNWLGGDEE